MIKLFDDQTKLVDTVRGLMRRNKAVLMQAATGAGKTVMTASMIQSSRIKGTRAMMVVPRRELLRQTAETFKSFDIPHSYVSAGYEFNPFAKTMLATSGTLARRLDKVPRPDVVFFDETHYGGSELDRIVKHYRALGSWVIGLSATPIRLDGKGLGMWYDAMAEGPPVADLIESKRLSSYRMFAPSAPDLSGVKTTAGDYAKGQLAERMETDRVLVGNAVSHYGKHAMGRLNVCYCVSIKHAEITAAAFRDAGIPSACIHGGMDDDERGRIIRSFARRQLMVLTSVDLLTFGFDLASAAQMDVTVECMSDLGPTQSLAKQMQKWGRVLRMKPEPALIFDHAGNSARHGLPDDPREWTLAGRDKREGGGDRQEPVRQCSNCYFVHRPSPTCPACGFVYPVQDRMLDEVDGELSEVSGLRVTPKQEQGIAASQDGLDGLIRLGASRGYKNPEMWAAKIMSARLAKRHVAR
jgi:superfamily II DNA or RNA helicase